MFMAKCCKRKIIRKSAEIAMANFLPIEELKIPLIFWLIFMLAKVQRNHFVTKLQKLFYFVFRIIIVNPLCKKLRIHFY